MLKTCLKRTPVPGTLPFLQIRFSGRQGKLVPETVGQRKGVLQLVDFTTGLEFEAYYLLRRISRAAADGQRVPLQMPRGLNLSQNTSKYSDFSISSSCLPRGYLNRSAHVSGLAARGTI